jgi:hypothetical protein
MNTERLFHWKFEEKDIELFEPLNQASRPPGSDALAYTESHAVVDTNLGDPGCN